MATSTRPRPFRLAVIGCLLFGLLVIYVGFRYLATTLFGFVTFRGLAPVVPLLVAGIHVLLFVLLAVGLAVYRGKSGLLLGTGMVLLSVEPLTSPVVFRDGCHVGGGVGGPLLPDATVQSGVVTFYAWSGACSISLNVPLVGSSVALVGWGLWRGSVPKETLSRWLALVET